jgi:PAS domain S-box-containing protein
MTFHDRGPSKIPSRMLRLIRGVKESRQASEALVRDDEEFNLVFEAASLGCWSWNSETERFTVNAGTRSILGLPSVSEVTFDVFWSTVHPDERERVHQEWPQFQHGSLPFSFAYRVLWADGTIHSVEMWGHAFDGAGKPMQMIGVVLDVTNRKNTEEALRAVSGRLIQAQEEERIRIARELHDDIGQRISLLAVELKRLEENPGLSGDQLHQDIEYLAQFAEATATSIQALSRTLHSSKLEILGISAAMKSLCAEFGRQNRTAIEFATNVSYVLPHGISLCLYRILQEGLHNAVKYSGAQRIFVQLHGGSDSVELTIRDSGTGFDVESVAAGSGLGLISMQERVHLVSGTIMIESAPSRGTTIRAKIPLEESTAARCA